MNKKRDPEKKSGLFIPIRQATAYSSLAFCLLGVVFMAGYFFGKNHITDQLVARIEQDSFADQISASLCSLYDQELQLEVVAQQEEILSKEDESAVSTEYYAQLIGYGTQKAARQFAQSLQDKGIAALVKTRKSQTAQGRQSVWYQVVTEPFTDKNELEQLTQRIAKSEKIQGIQIVSC